MKKIIMGFMGLAAVVAVVSTSAYAAWTDTVTVSGITMASGNANLAISENGTDALAEPVSLSGLNSYLNNFHPNKEVKQDFYLHNLSTSSIGLNVTAQLTSASTWGSLREYLWMKIDNTEDGGTTGWVTLESWNAAPRDLPGSLENQTDKDKMTVFVKMDPNAPDTVQAMSLDNITFKLVGQQIL